MGAPRQPAPLGGVRAEVCGKPVYARNKSIDAIVCTTTVDLFQRWNVAVAPREAMARRPAATLPDTIAHLPCDLPDSTLSLYLCCPSKLVLAAHRQRALRPNVPDWVREFTNQLAGKIARRYREFDIDLRLHLPESVSPEKLQGRIARATKMRFYEFRTLNGSVLLIVDGALGSLDAARANASAADQERSLIMFGQDD